jgi:negative regulator of replication initiation
MPQLQSIEIDWDIYQLVETERRSFDEPQYLALRRLLKLPAVPALKAPLELEAETGVSWVEDGVEVPHGSLARMEYLRGSQVYEGRFLNGKLVVNGKSYEALSAAASALAKTKDGSKPSLNGWLYWKSKFPGETVWRSLGEMRQLKQKS